MVFEALQDLLELTPKKDVLFIIGDWNAKVGSQEIPGVTGKFGLWVQNEAGQRLTEFCQENTLVIANTLFQQHKKRLYTWTSPDGWHWNQIDYILCSQRWRSSSQWKQDLSHIQLLVLFLLTAFSIFGCKEYNQSDFSVDHPVMSMCRVISWVVGRGYLLWPVLLAFALLHFVLKGQICLLLQVSLDVLVLHSSPL